jgi:hypothetical protein
VIDLGAEGGDAGGYVVGTGTPEEIMKLRGSHTGRSFASILLNRMDTYVETETGSSVESSEYVVVECFWQSSQTSLGQDS